jgi:predicted lipoprotein with Yx(FWY)xxD motif
MISQARKALVALALTTLSVPMMFGVTSSEAQTKPAAPAAAKKPSISIGVASSKLGNIMVDDKGLSLYMFTPDARNVSNCEAACLTAWPPIMLGKDDTLADVELTGGLRRSLLGVAMRENGSRHVTYNGWPLYYWFRDAKAGDVLGQWVGNVWFVLSPDGAPISTRV